MLRCYITYALCVVFLLFYHTSVDGQKEATSFAQEYAHIASVIKSKNLSALLQAHYYWRNPDGSLPSAQEVESVWKANFEAVKAYSSVQFVVESREAKENAVLVTVRRSVFYTLNGSDEEQIEVVRSQDRWEHHKEGWYLVYTESLPGSVTGHFVSNAPPSLQSPRLAALARALKAGTPTALTSFWREAQGKTPLIEPVEGSPHSRLVTYLWRGKQGTYSVQVKGGLPSTSAKPMARLPNSDVWYYSERLPANARYAYSLWVTEPLRKPTPNGKGYQMALAETYPPDPLNYRVFNDSPYVELPEAPKSEWLTVKSNGIKGRLSREVLTSKLLKEARTVTVYTPPNYDKDSTTCRLLILLDGEDYQNLIPAPTILDNLSTAKRIPPVVALLVHSQGTRFRDLRCSHDFADFIAEELVVWAKGHYRIAAGAESVTIGVLSLGGLAAGYCALKHNQVFGNVISQSGAFWYGCLKTVGWRSSSQAHCLQEQGFGWSAGNWNR